MSRTKNTQYKSAYVSVAQSTNIGLSSKVACDINLRLFSQEMLMNLIRYTCLKITYPQGRQVASNSCIPDPTIRSSSSFMDYLTDHTVEFAITWIYRSVMEGMLYAWWFL